MNWKLTKFYEIDYRWMLYGMCMQYNESVCIIAVNARVGAKMLLKTKQYGGIAVGILWENWPEFVGSSHHSTFIVGVNDKSFTVIRLWTVVSKTVISLSLSYWIMDSDQACDGFLMFFFSTHMLFRDYAAVLTVYTIRISYTIIRTSVSLKLKPQWLLHTHLKSSA